MSSTVMGQMVAFHFHHIFHAKWALSGKKMYVIWVSMYLAESSWGHYFYISLWRRDRHFETWSSEPCEGLPVCSARQNLSFSVTFKTLSIDPAPGIEPATSRSAVKRSTDWANHAAVKMVRWNIKTFYFFLFFLLFFYYIMSILCGNF